MFSGWSATQLFAPASPDNVEQFTPVSKLDTCGTDIRTSDDQLSVEVFVDINEEDNRAIATRIRSAQNIFFIAHTGYNAMVSQE